MTRSLAAPVPAPRLPIGLRVAHWESEAAHPVHQLLEACYRHGGGSVDPFDEWLERFTSDVEFEPESCFLAWHGQHLAGAVLCWSSAFIKDLCVDARFRRRGLGSSLTATALAHFRRRGASAVELRSHSDNPSGANELYRKLGFVEAQEVTDARSGTLDDAGGGASARIQSSAMSCCNCVESTGLTR